jgi:hypothetical protein
MAQNKRPRKKYTPKNINPASWQIGFQGSFKLSVHDALLRAEKLNIAVDEIITGKNTVTNWRDIFNALNMAEMWVRQGVINAESKDAIEETQSSIVDIHGRLAQGTKALYPGEIAQLHGFCEDYADILTHVTHSQYFKAEQAVERKLRQILSGNVNNDVVMQSHYLEAA